MEKLRIMMDNRGQLTTLIKDLIRNGWVIESIPEDGRIPRNGLNLILKLDNEELRVRVFTYKVTTSGRNRPHERRVEITTTYLSGLRKTPRYSDVVIGIDAASGKYVGIDGSRLKMGGKTHNASSFFDLEGLSVKKGELLINPRSVLGSQFPGGIEHHAFFDGSRLAEYLFNHRDIHSGVYTFGGSFKRYHTLDTRVPLAIAKTYSAYGDAFVMSSRIKRIRHSYQLSEALIAAVEERDFSHIRRKKITPEELKKLLSYCDEIGVIGEQAVLVHERNRLSRLGFHNKADQVERVSLRSVGEGFDILSFEDDGVTKRYLEVKATSSNSAVVDMSQGEWKAALRFGDRYYLVRVTRAKDAPKLFFVQNPCKLEGQGLVTRTPTGWRVDLRRVMRSPGMIV